jgi:hypothetical protein
MQADIALVGDTTHDESNVIESACYESAWVAGADGHDQIAELVTVPVAIGGEDRISDAGFLAWRSVEREPRRNRGH